MANDKDSEAQDIIDALGQDTPNGGGSKHHDVPGNDKPDVDESLVNQGYEDLDREPSSAEEFLDSHFAAAVIDDSKSHATNERIEDTAETMSEIDENAAADPETVELELPIMGDELQNVQVASATAVEDFESLLEDAKYDSGHSLEFDENTREPAYSEVRDSPEGESITQNEWSPDTSNPNNESVPIDGLQRAFELLAMIEKVRPQGQVKGGALEQGVSSPSLSSMFGSTTNQQPTFGSTKEEGVANSQQTKEAVEMVQAANDDLVPQYPNVSAFYASQFSGRVDSLLLAKEGLETASKRLYETDYMSELAAGSTRDELKAKPDYQEVLSDIGGFQKDIAHEMNAITQLIKDDEEAGLELVDSLQDTLEEIAQTTDKISDLLDERLVAEASERLIEQLESLFPGQDKKQAMGM